MTTLKKLLIVLILPIWMGCSLFSHTTSTITTIHDTINVTSHDTIVTTQILTVYDTVTQNYFTYLRQDSAPDVIYLQPALADSYPEIEAALNYAQTGTGYRIRLSQGQFSSSHPLVVYKFNGFGDYAQSWVNIEGFTNAKNTPGNVLTQIIFTSSYGFGFGIQQGKGCIVKNILFQGAYHFPDNLGELRVDTLRFNQWSDGVCSDNASSPYAGIVIDPFSDPAYYDGITYQKYKGMDSFYLPGMQRSGSTFVQVEGCYIQNFVIGMITSPSHQWNAEMINLWSSQIGNVKVCYAFTQAQSKVNTIKDCMSWGCEYEFLDGESYGIRNGDGSTCPSVDGLNIAGFMHQFIYHLSGSFPAADLRNIYAEGMFKLGVLSGGAADMMTGCTFDFALAHDGVPSPDVMIFGRNITFVGCSFRVYSGSAAYGRITIDAYNALFTGGQLGYIPLFYQYSRFDSLHAWAPRFDNVWIYYAGITINTNVQMSKGALVGNSLPLTINKSDYTGYFTGYDGVAPVAVGDILTTPRGYEDQLGQNPNVGPTYNYPVGYVTGVSKDTVFLIKAGWGLNNGPLNIYVDKVLP